MSVTMPKPKQCPKCGGIMNWVIITQFPNLPLKGNEHLVTMGYSCHGKNNNYLGGCKHFEDHSPKPE